VVKNLGKKFRAIQTPLSPYLLKALQNLKLLDHFRNSNSGLLIICRENPSQSGK
jgi:hypothetical protein